VSLHYVIFGGTAGAEDWSPLVILAEQSTISTMSHSNTEE
jgi:hypothetical protein